MKKSIIILMLSIVSIVSIYLGIKGCQKPPINQDNTNTIMVTPIVSQTDINKLNLTSLPNNETPITVIPVVAPVSKPGKIITSNVVVSDKGNTFIAYSEKIDLSFKFEPKVSFGVSQKLLLGADITVFSWYRFNIDTLAYFPIEGNFDIKNMCVGIGASYQLTNNTSTGIGYTTNFKNEKSVVGFISLKF